MQRSWVCSCGGGGGVKPRAKEDAGSVGAGLQRPRRLAGALIRRTNSAGALTVIKAVEESKPDEGRRNEHFLRINIFEPTLYAAINDI